MGTIETMPYLGEINSPGVLYGIFVSSDFGEFPFPGGIIPQPFGDMGMPCKGVIIQP